MLQNTDILMADLGLAHFVFSSSSMYDIATTTTATSENIVGVLITGSGRLHLFWRARGLEKEKGNSKYQINMTAERNENPMEDMSLEWIQARTEMYKMQPESFTEKSVRKFKSNPLVPIGKA